MASFGFDKSNLILLENLANQIANNDEVKSIEVLKRLVPEFILLTEEQRQKYAL
jgi:phage terminase Nu1 subunit (DNA packaging protein)